MEIANEALTVVIAYEFYAVGGSALGLICCLANICLLCHYRRRRATAFVDMALPLATDTDDDSRPSLQSQREIQVAADAQPPLLGDVQLTEAVTIPLPSRRRAISCDARNTHRATC